LILADQMSHYAVLLTAVVIPAEEGRFIALNSETGSTTQRESVPEAIGNLREATELYLEEFPLQPIDQPLVTGT
jgi:predicted RNase H-like HicB family nuclease